MSVQRTPGSPPRQQAEPHGMNAASDDPSPSSPEPSNRMALLDIVSRLEEVIDELKVIGQDFSAQLVGMARLELMMTAHRISEQEMGALRSLFEDEYQAPS